MGTRQYQLKKDQGPATGQSAAVGTFGAGCSVQSLRPGGPRGRGGNGMEFQEQFDDVLALQDVPFESESASDDTETATQDAIVWGDLGWCRYTK